MSRALSLFVSIAFVVGCGAGEAGQPQGSSSPQEAVDRAVDGESLAAEGGALSCRLLEGALPGLVEVDLAAATVRGKEMMGHDLCTVSWPLAAGESAKRYGNEVSLTVMGTVFDSSEAAVASLESAVSTLEQGVTVEAGGEKRTVKSGFGDWVDGVGERAITKKRSVLAAAGVRRFQVAARVNDDDAENQRIAIELGKRIAEGL